MRMRIVSVATMAVVCAAFGVGPERARACINGVAIEVDPRVYEVSQASVSLGKDAPLDAAKRLLKAFPKMRTARLDGWPIQVRAMQLMAVATVRLDGAVGVGSEWSAATPESRDANYKWAVSCLRGLSIKRPTDPAVLTDLGEALAKRDATKDEAKRMLELLAPKDLMATAYGWAALARLRLAAGDSDGRDAAVLKCAKMARDARTCKTRGDFTNVTSPT